MRVSGLRKNIVYSLKLLKKKHKNTKVGLGHTRAVVSCLQAQKVRNRNPGVVVPCSLLLTPHGSRGESSVVRMAPSNPLYSDVEDS